LRKARRFRRAVEPVRSKQLQTATWKIQLPACASPTEAAGLQRRIADLTRVTDDITSRIGSGAFGDSAEARIALVTAEQSVLPETK
jgi:hypothetical protein